MRLSAPLEGVRVVEVSRALPGRWAGGVLADFGADVLSIVEPGYSERAAQRGEVALESVVVNQRNKRSIAVDLRHEAGRNIALELAKTADGFLESNRPGVVRRLGVDYETIRSVNPSIVYCSLSGFGQYGPYANIATHDLSYQGIAGALPCDERGRPQATALAYADRNAAWSGAMAMLVGLLERCRSGSGQYVDVSFCDITVTLPPGGSSEIQGRFASYTVYGTKDGEYLTLSTRELPYWQRVCELVGHPEWTAQMRPEDETLREEQLAVFRDFFKQRTPGGLDVNPDEA